MSELTAKERKLLKFAINFMTANLQDLQEDGYFDDWDKLPRTWDFNGVAEKVMGTDWNTKVE
jgi:hypothetical protein